MEEERYQKELFEFDDRPKRPLSKLSGILPKPDFEGKIAITLTLEKIVFVSIGIVMVMIIVFALGVESGKRRQAVSQPVIKQQPQVKTLQATAGPKSFLNTAPAAQDPKQVTAAKAAASPVRIEGAPDSTRPYSIVAATFAKKETAQSTAAFLKKEGLNAFVAYSQPYYRVCVGAYAQMQGPDVQRDMTRVKRFYKDAFVRLR